MFMLAPFGTHVLGTDLCSSEVAQYILRIHLLVHSKAGACHTPLGMPQKNNVN